MIRQGVSDQAPIAPIRIIGPKVKETMVGTMLIITTSVTMSEMVITTATTTSTRVTIVTEMIGVSPMFYLQIVKLVRGMVEIVCCELRI